VRWGRRGLAAPVAAALLLTACGDSPPAPSAPTALSSTGTRTTGASAEKGKQVWLGQCVACHNPDPSQDGPLGPAVKGSSRELLDARVVRGEYPPGYIPKRPTKAMPPRPDLAPSIPDLTAYLQ
jgi:mono/diheme cytochrome c family protein